MKWQPIETAPRDETPLLLFTPDVGICIGRYGGLREIDFGGGVGPDRLNSPQTPEL